ncbi:MAG: 3-deoxy-D-manno-octulosonate 8-phosphate phosphatase (KDO 8-P phosphatase) [Bacteroidetes bacterium]|nr:MAG: 3-deoxy-D-manno-octulosonate 8-phosphate phosphatase (KDO 8-P phosphatase) [Bacteroidota bacterium]
MEKNFKQLMREIKALVFDIDGVLTDGSLMLFENGELGRSFNTKDTYAIRRASDAGLITAVISYASTDNLRGRLQSVGMKEVYLHCTDKKEKLGEFCLAYDLDPSTVLFMGDDLPDLQAMLSCGLPVCPADAAHEIKAICPYVSPYPGGRACVRDVIEQVLRVQGKWE